MAIIKMSSDEARSKWREVIDTAVAGDHIIIERYGKPVVAIVSHPQFLQTFTQENVLKEPRAVYQTAGWDRETLKAELLDEIKEELLAEPLFRQAMQYEPAQMEQSKMIQLKENAADAQDPKRVHVYSPRLVHPAQAADFKKEIVVEAPDANI